MTDKVLKPQISAEAVAYCKVKIEELFELGESRVGNDKLWFLSNLNKYVNRYNALSCKQAAYIKKACEKAGVEFTADLTGHIYPSKAK